MADQQTLEKRRRTRRILWQWGNWVQRINHLENERTSAERWVDDARITLHAQNLDGMPHGGKTTDLSNVVENIIEREAAYKSLLDSINASIADTIRLRDTIQRLVCQLTPLQEKIVTYRYIDGHSWNYIIIKTGMAESYIKKIESEAVDYIGQHIE